MPLCYMRSNAVAVAFVLIFQVQVWIAATSSVQCVPAGLDSAACSLMRLLKLARVLSGEKNGASRRKRHSIWPVKGEGVMQSRMSLKKVLSGLK
ncbi:MAG: hypothetical protein D4R48_00710 [Nitrosomonadales bacterium]|nr:MAG: hypothetical protein D4R48_00710 [Nitrosomonadales bacterium]